jgi:hypothetical protein
MGRTSRLLLASALPAIISTRCIDPSCRCHPTRGDFDKAFSGCVVKISVRELVWKATYSNSLDVMLTLKPTTANTPSTEFDPLANGPAASAAATPPACVPSHPSQLLRLPSPHMSAPLTEQRIGWDRGWRDRSFHYERCAFTRSGFFRQVNGWLASGQTHRCFDAPHTTTADTSPEGCGMNSTSRMLPVLSAGSAALHSRRRGKAVS